MWLESSMDIPMLNRLRQIGYSYINQDTNWIQWRSLSLPIKNFDKQIAFHCHLQLSSWVYLSQRNDHQTVVPGPSFSDTTTWWKAWGWGDGSKPRGFRINIGAEYSLTNCCDMQTRMPRLHFMLTRVLVNSIPGHRSYQCRGSRSSLWFDRCVGNTHHLHTNCLWYL